MEIYVKELKRPLRPLILPFAAAAAAWTCRRRPPPAPPPLHRPLPQPLGPGSAPPGPACHGLSWRRWGPAHLQPHTVQEQHVSTGEGGTLE